MDKLDQDGTIDSKEWLLATKAIFIKFNTILLELIENLGLDMHTWLKTKESKGSGLFTKRMGKYCPWPAKFPGHKHIVTLI